MYAELERKFCRICKTDKSVDDFYNDRRRPDGLAYMCKACKKKEVADSRINNPERWKKKRHRALLAEKFGISANEYYQMFKVQRGRCAICRKHQSKFKKRLFVDHCHSSKIIRGLLCQRCNFAIGLFDESEKIFKSAISYLKKFKN